MKGGHGAGLRDILKVRGRLRSASGGGDRGKESGVLEAVTSGQIIGRPWSKGLRLPAKPAHGQGLAQCWHPSQANAVLP